MSAPGATMRRVVVGLSLTALVAGAVVNFVATGETPHEGCLRRCYAIVTPQYLRQGRTVAEAHHRCDTDPDICLNVQP